MRWKIIFSKSWSDVKFYRFQNNSWVKHLLCRIPKHKLQKNAVVQPFIWKAFLLRKFTPTRILFYTQFFRNMYQKIWIGRTMKNAKKDWTGFHFLRDTNILWHICILYNFWKGNVRRHICLNLAIVSIYLKVPRTPKKTYLFYFGVFKFAVQNAQGPLKAFDTSNGKFCLDKTLSIVKITLLFLNPVVNSQLKQNFYSGRIQITE